MAKRYIETALVYSKDLFIGNGPQGPFDHLLRLKSTSCRREAFNPSDLFLYAVTDSRMNKRWGRSITDAVKAAIAGGATIIQLRFVTVEMCYLCAHCNTDTVLSIFYLSPLVLLLKFLYNLTFLSNNPRDLCSLL